MKRLKLDQESPEKLLKVFLMSQANAENAITLWCDTLNLIKPDEEITIIDFDKRNKRLNVKIRKRVNGS